VTRDRLSTARDRNACNVQHVRGSSRRIYVDRTPQSVLGATPLDKNPKPLENAFTGPQKHEVRSRAWPTKAETGPGCIFVAFKRGSEAVRAQTAPLQQTGNHRRSRRRP